MTGPPRIRSSAFASVIIALLIAVAGSACGGDDRPPAPTASGSADQTPDYLKTPLGRRQLPEGAFAIGWDGQGEQVTIREEPLPAGYSVETVVTGLEQPVDLAFLPDGIILVTEQYSGRIRLIENGVLRGEPFAQVEGVVQGRLEQGLLGIAIDPQFAESRWVYVFYVEGEGEEPLRSVLLRLTELGGAGVEPAELGELPVGFAGQHNGGGLRFGPDGKLYLTLGDTSRDALAADITEPVGKILRLERDGSAAPDNPFVDEFGADPRVFALGFRNVFGIAFHPGLPGGLIAFDNAEFEGDEVNLVRPGGDYGWPDGEGEEPIWMYLNNVGPAGAVVYGGGALAEFQGDLFFCQFHRGGALHRVRLSPDLSRVESDAVVATGCTSTVAEGPDGLLYFLDRNNGELLRIVPSQ